MVSAGPRAAGVRDILDYALFGWDEQTEYATGFDERRWKLVRAGMAETDVVGLLGPPLERFADDSGSSQTLFYSRGAADGSHWHRSVTLDRSGRVVRVTGLFYYD